MFVPSRLLLIVPISIVCNGASFASPSSSVQSAQHLCALIDGSKLTSAPCSVSGANSSVEFSVDMRAQEAIKTCSALAGLAASRGLQFDAGWSIRIYSPFSNGNTVATCSL